MILPISIALSALIFLPGISEPVTTPKAVWLVLVALITVVVRWNPGMRFPYLWPFGLFVLWDLGSFFFASDIGAWIWGFSSDLLGIVFFYHALNFGSKKEFDVFSKAIVITGLALYAFYLFFLYFPDSSLYFTKNYLSTVNRQVFVFQSMLIPLALFTFWMAKWPWKIPSAAAVVAAIAYLAETGSVTGLAYILVVLFVLLILFALTFEDVPTAVGSLGVIAMLVVLLTLAFSNSGFIHKQIAQKMDGRIEMWRAAGTMAISHGFGVGRGNYYIGTQERIYETYFTTVEYEGGKALAARLTLREAHNDFLQMAAELGPIGAGLFFYCVLIALCPLRNRRAPAALFLAQYAILIAALVWFPFQRHLFAVLFFYMGGLAWGIEREGKENYGL